MELNLWIMIFHLSNKEIDILLETSKGGQTYAFFIVALGTGMRMGEILGLILRMELLR
jgi:integrase